MMVLDSYPPDLNGGAYFTHRLAQSLQALGHTILVICPSRSLSQGFSTYDGVNLYGVRSWPVMGYPHFRICWPFFIKKPILKTIQHFKPDVVHLQGKFFLGGICYRWCLKQGIPLMATNHFMPENFFHYTKLPQSAWPWFKRVTWRIVIDMLKHVRLVTTPTQTAAKLLQEVGLKTHIHVISCGIDLDKFKPNQDASHLRRRFQIPNQPILLYTGRLDYEKNIPTIIRAFHQLRRHLDVHLVLTGRGAERDILQTLISTLNLNEHVTLTGYLSDDEYPLIYGLADCFVHAGVAELQSIVALEAIASGLPLVVANAMALPELVMEGGNGHLFEPDDVDGLSHCLWNIFNHSEVRKRMGHESRVLAEQHSLHHTARQYIALYEDMLRF